MTARTALRIAHVVVSVGVLGADLALLTLTAAGLHGTDPHTIYPAAHRIGLWAAIPLAVAALTTGAALVAVTGLKPWHHGWLAIKTVITVTLTGLLIGVLVPGLGRLAAGQPAHTGQILDTVAPAVAASLLILNVILGIARPRLARPKRPTRPAPA
ncbi:hypothetical protein ACFPIJ_36460 [Dactylosporangium cerinum]|uniref:Integral membrane protein n=1 Tax=Dactylosporangium cerinum TaxID=1434730 RepID=A0ABV9W3U4_9ACTN